MSNLNYTAPDFATIQAKNKFQFPALPSLNANHITILVIFGFFAVMTYTMQNNSKSIPKSTDTILKAEMKTKLSQEAKAQLEQLEIEKAQLESLIDETETEAKAAEVKAEEVKK